jgi:hypothetical protein
LFVAGGEGVEAAIENPLLVEWVRRRAAQAVSPRSAPGARSCWLESVPAALKAS